VNRQQEALQLAEQLLEDIEMRRLKATETVLKATRLARLVGREDLQTFLRLERESYPNKDDSIVEWIARADRWRPVGDGEDDDGGRKFFAAPLSRIEALLESTRVAIDALKSGGNYSGQWAATAAARHDQNISRQAASMGKLSAVSGAVVSTVYGMVTEIYHELLFSELQATLFADTQERVDGALAETGGSSLDKIERVSERLRDGDPESVSQALTTCRRLIDSCADHLFPAQEDLYDLGGEATLKVGKANVLNRLQAFCHQQGASKSRRDRLRRSLSDLYERCSAGTHAEVSVQEARFVFLQTYIVLGEVLALQEK
jgi:hypothetical protein